MKVILWVFLLSTIIFSLETNHSINGLFYLSDYIVIAELTKVERSSAIKKNQLYDAESEFKIIKVLKGEKIKKSICILTKECDNPIFQVSLMQLGYPIFKKKKKYILFLSKNDNSSKYFSIIGNAQGSFIVNNENNTEFLQIEKTKFKESYKMLKYNVKGKNNKEIYKKVTIDSLKVLFENLKKDTEKLNRVKIFKDVLYNKKLSKNDRIKAMKEYNKKLYDKFKLDKKYKTIDSANSSEKKKKLIQMRKEKINKMKTRSKDDN